MITNASILGSTTAGTATGNIVFSTDTVALTGNDNNTVSNCNIGPVGANLPTKGIYFLGTTTTAANNNSGVVINNNNIFHFPLPSLAQASLSAVGIPIATLPITGSIKPPPERRRLPVCMLLSWYPILPVTIFRLRETQSASPARPERGRIPSQASQTPLRESISIVGGTTASNIQNNVVAGISQTTAASGTGTSAPFMALYPQTG